MLALDAELLGQGVFGCALVALLAGLTRADLTRMILPDRLNAALAACGLARALALGTPSPMDAGIGALIASAVFFLVGTAFRHGRGYDGLGLGLGDVKLAGASGFWIGWQGIPLMVLIASLTALIVVAARVLMGARIDARTRLPFGPFLCMGTLAAWLLMVMPR